MHQSLRNALGGVAEDPCHLVGIACFSSGQNWRERRLQRTKVGAGGLVLISISEVSQCRVHHGADSGYVGHGALQRVLGVRPHPMSGDPAARTWT